MNILYHNAQLIRSNHKIEEIQSLWLYIYIEITSIYSTTTRFVVDSYIVNEPEYYSYFGDALNRYNNLAEQLKEIEKTSLTN